MRSLKQKATEIINNKDSFPSCIVNHAKKIHDIITASNNSAIAIKRSYKDIWIDFIKHKRLIKSSRNSLFKYLSTNHKRTLLGEFYKLYASVSIKKAELTYRRHKLEAELRLLYADTNELLEVLNFIESYNRRVKTRCWIDALEPEIFSEIILWRSLTTGACSRRQQNDQMPLGTSV